MAEVTQACKNLYKGETLSDTPLYDELEEKWNAVCADLDYISGLQADPAVADEGRYAVGSLVCEACATPTRKRKLFGRNSQCEGCV